MGVRAQIAVALAAALWGGRVDAAEPAKTGTVAAKLDAARAKAFGEACTSSCEKRSRTRAVAWAMIKAGCEKRCEDEQALPFVVRGTELKMGTRVRLIGRIGQEGRAFPRSEPSAPRWTIALSDGRTIGLQFEDPSQATGLGPGDEALAAGLILEPLRGRLELRASTIIGLRSKAGDSTHPSRPR